MIRFKHLLIGLVASPLLIGGAMGGHMVGIGGVSFVPKNFDIASGQSDVIAADINHDGHQDIVATNHKGNEVIVFLGNKQEHLAHSGRFPAGENPVSLAAADFNSDTFLDLVVANHETSYLTLLIGDGEGEFRPAPEPRLAVDVSPHPHAVRAADINNDGHIDVVVDHRGGKGLLILMGLGDATFKAPSQFVSVGGDPYRGMAIGDVNGDGRADLVTPNPDAVGVVLSTGSKGLGFAEPTTLAMASPFAVDLADFNGDGFLDVIAASDGGASRVEIFSGDGKGSFHSSDHFACRIASGAKNIAVGDINADGFADAMVSSWNSDLVVILGGLNSFQIIRIHNEGNPWGLAISDLNNDGKDDLIVADGTQTEATVYLSLGD